MRKREDQALPAKLLAVLFKLVSPLPPLPVQTVDSIVFLRPEAVAYIATSGSSLEVVDEAGTRWRRFDTISGLMKRLQADPYFFKANRGAIINLRMVRTLRTTDTGVHEVTFAGLDEAYKVAVADSVFAAFKKAMGLTIKES